MLRLLLSLAFILTAILFQNCQQNVGSHSSSNINSLNGTDAFTTQPSTSNQVNFDSKPISSIQSVTADIIARIPIRSVTGIANYQYALNQINVPFRIFFVRDVAANTTATSSFDMLSSQEKQTLQDQIKNQIINGILTPQCNGNQSCLTSIHAANARIDLYVSKDVNSLFITHTQSVAIDNATLMQLESGPDFSTGPCSSNVNQKVLSQYMFDPTIIHNEMENQLANYFNSEDELTLIGPISPSKPTAIKCLISNLN